MLVNPLNPIDYHFIFVESFPVLLEFAQFLSEIDIEVRVETSHSVVLLFEILPIFQVSNSDSEPLNFGRISRSNTLFSCPEALFFLESSILGNLVLCD